MVKISYHSTNHDQLRAQILVQCKHVQNAEEEHHVIERKDNSRRVETRVARGDRNAAENETWHVRRERKHVEEIPRIRRVVFEL